MLILVLLVSEIMSCYIVCLSRPAWPTNVFRVEVTTNADGLLWFINSCDPLVEPAKIESTHRAHGHIDQVEAALTGALKIMKYYDHRGYYCSTLDNIKSVINSVITAQVADDRDEKHEQVEGQPPGYNQSHADMQHSAQQMAVAHASSAPVVPIHVPIASPLVPIVPRTTESDQDEIKNGPKNLAIYFLDGEKIRHTIPGTTLRWVATYSKNKNALVMDDRDWSTIGGFASSHYGATIGYKKANGWVQCEVWRVDSDGLTRWISCKGMKSPYQIAHDL
jgi:hypothetical protein